MSKKDLNASTRSGLRDGTLRSTGLSRRNLLRLAITTAGAASISSLLAACGGDDDDDSAVEAEAQSTTDSSGSAEDSAAEIDEEATSAETSEDGQDQSSGTPKSGGELVLANEQSPVSLDPHFVRDVGSTRAMLYMYDSLIEVDKQTELVPWLATSWEISDDGLQYTLELQENVAFHDGTPFNGEAVKFNLERHQNPDVSTAFIDDFTLYLDNVEVLDDQNVQLNMKQMYAQFAREFLSTGSGNMISPTAGQEMGSEFAQQPVGSGPFKYEEYVKDSHLVVTRNEEYWAGTPYLDSIRVRIIPEQGVQILELEAGTVDISFSIQAKDIGRLEDADVTIVNQLAPTATWISMNLAKGPTQELAVRQAIARSVDKEAVLSELLLGYGAISRGGAAEGWPRYHEDIPIVEYNPEEAGKILDEAGWVMGDDGIRQRDGEPLAVNILSTQLERQLSYGLMNELIDEALRNLGFQTELQTMEWGTYLDEFRAGEFWEVTFHAQNSNSYAEAGATIDPDAYWNVNQLDAVEEGSELADIADRVREIMAELEKTIDPEERAAVYKEIQMLTQEHVLVGWLVHWDFLVGVQPRVQGLTVKPTLQDTLHEVHLIWLEQ